MPRREDDAHAVYLDCSSDEAEAMAQMRAMCGIDSDANLIRTALWNFSEHLDMNIDLRLGVFDMRPRKGFARGRGNRTKATA